MQKLQNQIANFAILVLGMLLCGMVSLLLGKELSWDLAYYHYYNAFAYLNPRAQLDYWDNIYIHQYINPAIDLLTYFLIQSISPVWSAFILGAIHGINICLIYLVSKSLIQNHYSKSIAVFLAFISINGPNALPEIGSFQNDSFISLFIFGHILLTFYAIRTTAFQTKLIWILFAGVLLGMGAGLKLTAGLFIPASLFALLILRLGWQTTTLLLGSLLLGIASGMLLTSGHWMYQMWTAHGNPVFPFFNNIFQSPDFSPIHWRDHRFLPRSISEHILFPFLFSWDGRSADVPFRDFRFSFIYILTLLSCIKLIKYSFFSKSQTQEREVKQNASIIHLKWWFFSFYLFSYVLWQAYFSIARYIIALEMLAPLVIYLLTINLFTKFIWRVSVLSIIFVTLNFFMQPVSTPRMQEFGITYFNVQLPKSINEVDNALVLIAHPVPVINANPRPQSYLIPFFPHTWQFIGVPFIGNKFIYNSNVMTYIQHKIKPHSPVYLLTTNFNLSAFLKVLPQFGLEKANTCEKVNSDRLSYTGENAWLCPLRVKN